MTDTTKVTNAASGTSSALPTDALKDAGQRLLGLLVQRAADSALERVENMSSRLTGVAENGGQLLGSRSGRGGSDEADDPGGSENGDGGEGKQGLLSRIGSAVGGVKDKVAEAVGGGGGGGGQGKKLKVTNIVEEQDVGLPVRTTYDLWTQFSDFPGFMKKLETVEQASDEKTNWTAKVFWSRRTWEATIVEQVPDSHIVWKSTGAKGHVDGAVAFTALGPNLTRVLLVLEYWPKGFFEQTGNIWRAQGRRARLEFKHFRRHAMTNALLRQDEIEGWRGEIRDSEVVKTHEEALEEEQRQDSEDRDAGAQGEPDTEPDEAAPDEDGPDDASETNAEEARADDEDVYDDADEPDDETDDVYDEADDGYDDEADDQDYDDADDTDESDDRYVDDEEDLDDARHADEDAEDREDDERTGSVNGRSRRREPAGARSRRGGGR
ncbi:MAG: SRPBCC family protein [Pseudonocardia sp.]